MRNLLVLVIVAAAIAGGLAQTKTSTTPAPKATTAARQTQSATPTKATAAKPSAPAKPGATAKQATQPAPSKDEQQLFDSVNRERAARQLPPLKWNAALATAARAHAQKMAQAGTLSHQFPGEMDMGMRIRVAGVRFRSAAENVAQGPSAAVIHTQWMNSQGHRDNILDRELDSLGVAVVQRNGELFAVQDFALASQ